MTPLEQQQFAYLTDQVNSLKAILSVHPYMLSTELGSTDWLVHIELRDLGGGELRRFELIDFWLSDSATDPALTGTPCDVISAMNGTVLETVTSGKRVTLVTQDGGCATAQVTLTAGTHTWYPWISVGGIVYVGGAIVFP